MAMIVIDRAAAGISGGTVTLTPSADLGTKPSHLAPNTTVVFNAANPAPAEFWEVSATKGTYYRITIERLG
jgi:hypothetical protein